VLGVGIWIVARQAYGWHHLVAGKHGLQADHCRDAFEHFQASLEIWPEDPTTLFLAARAARRVGDFEAAERYLTKCQASSSMVEPAALERVLLRATRGEIDAVGGFCQALLDQGHPDTPLILEALAQGEMVSLRFASASGYLDQWIEKSPDQPQALFLKGRLQLQASNSQEALGLLRRAVELDPERDDARLLLAGLYLDLGQAREALPHLEEARRRLPRNLIAKARMGQCLVLLGRQEDAIVLLDEVLRQNPDLPSALLERGKLALRDGELDKAELWLQKACKRDPGNRAAHYQLLQCLKQEGKATEARTVQQRLDQIDQDSTRMREIVTDLLPKRRNDPNLHAELGELFLNIGAVPEGVSWLNRALQLDPRNPLAHRTLAKHYHSLGQSGKAQQHRELGGEPK
jgi:tetratricopeptide (TPR) repeat protein